MRDGRLPVLWLCGPPGAGKSAAGWALYEGLAWSGARAGFIDIDQLGMCAPSPDDLHRYRLKERNLSAMAANFRVAGCDALVAAGDLGPSAGLSASLLPGAFLTICHLRVSAGEQRRRLTSRGQGADFIAGALRQAEELDRASFADARVDLWRTFHAAGVRCLILSGPVPDKRAAAGYAGALPAARLTVCRLHAGPAELAHRISRRGQGLNSWAQPGDPLLDKPEAHLRLAAAESAAEAETLERSNLGDLRIDTNGRTVPQVADLITQHW